MRLSTSQFVRRLLSGVAILAISAGFSIAQPPPEVRNYTANFVTTPPVIDGVVGATEWNAASPAAGDWRLLREDGTVVDNQNNSFRVLWDADAMYILNTSTFGGWLPPIGGGGMSFGDDNINIYIDPNRDNEDNFAPGFGQSNPDSAVDGYQIAWNQYLGTSECGFDGMPLTADDCSIDTRGAPNQSNLTGSSFGTFTEAHDGTPFGNQAEWAGMRLTTIKQNYSASGGVFEARIPWTDIDAAAQPSGVPTGLDVEDTAPVNGEAWFFNMSRISTDGGNFLPIWNWHSAQSFALHPHGELIFAGRPAAVGGDFNNDGLFNCADINALTNAVATGGSVATFDLNGDAALTLADVDRWRANAGGVNIGAGRVYTVGDANLDGVTDGSDFGIWNSNKFTSNTAWCSGNFNADAVVDGSDFGLWNANKFTSADNSVVPEPASIVGLAFALAGAVCLRRR